MSLLKWGSLGNAPRSGSTVTANTAPGTTRPKHQPTATAAGVVAEIEFMRRTRKWSASRITFELRMDGTDIARRTVTKILRNLGLNRRRFIDPNGETNRKPQVIIAKQPGQMVHVNIKKVGKIPDGGGWRVHGRGSEQAKRSQRRKTKNNQARIGYTYLHSAIDGNTRLAYTEARNNETAATAIDFMNNARLFFAAHGITRIERVITDNGSCYRAADFTVSLGTSRHERITDNEPRRGVNPSTPAAEGHHTGEDGARNHSRTEERGPRSERLSGLHRLFTPGTDRTTRVRELLDR